MTTAQVVETSVIVNNNSPIQDYVHPDHQTQPTFEMTLRCKPSTKILISVWILSGKLPQSCFLHIPGVFWVSGGMMLDTKIQMWRKVTDINVWLSSVLKLHCLSKVSRTCTVWNILKIDCWLFFLNNNIEELTKNFVLKDDKITLRKQPTFRDATTGFPRNEVWGTSAEIPCWTPHTPDLGSASDWLKQISLRGDQSEAPPRSE